MLHEVDPELLVYRPELEQWKAGMGVHLTVDEAPDGWSWNGEVGFSDEQIYTTLEMKMKCGVGVCGRCNTDHRYICKDGPVFRMDKMGGLE